MSGIGLPHVAARIFNRPLMILPGKLDAILYGLRKRLGVEVERPKRYKALSRARGERTPEGYRRVGSVGVVDVSGVLAHFPRVEADSSFIQGYQSIARSLQAALEDGAVRDILLSIDSPGGEVDGLFDLAEQVREASKIKPVTAVTASTAASAAYVLGAAASEGLSMSRAAEVGSIGVVARHVDLSRAAEREGLKVTYVFAGAHKIDGNPWEPLPDGVREDWQRDIDSLYALMVSTVAEYRGLTPEAIRGTEARMYRGRAAIGAGLADRIETPDQVLERLNSGAARTGTVPGNTTAEALDMSDTKTVGLTEATTSALPEDPPAPEDTIVQMPGAVTPAERIQDGAGGGSALGERARIRGILGCDEAAKRPELARYLALETELSEEQAIGILRHAKTEELSAEGGPGFAEYMASLGNPPVGPDAEAPQDEVAAMVARILNA